MLGAKLSVSGAASSHGPSIAGRTCPRYIYGYFVIVSMYLSKLGKVRRGAALNAFVARYL